MKNLSTYILLFTLFIISCASPASKDAEHTISVFCGAGLSPAISEISTQYRSDKNVDIRLNIGSSGTLARQIEQGNPADIFISASNDWAAYAEKYGMFSRKAILCKNSLVFIAPVNSTLDSLPLLPDFNPAVMFDGYLSMGDPEHVPAGRYARETLLALGWDSIFHNRILPAKDVRSALILVEMAECELGIVYYSDALHSTKIKIVAHIPDSLHSPIVFYALLSKNAPEPVVHFYDYLWSRDNIAIWEKFGLGGVY